MAEVLVTPNVLSASTAFLRSGLGSLADHVATKVPKTMPSSMVKVSPTGGSRRDVASDSVQLTVECWDDDDAYTLARTAYAIALSAAGQTVGGLFVRKVETVGGVQDFPDPDISKPRAQFTVRWHVKPATI